MIILPIEHIKFRYMNTILFYIYNKYKLLVPVFYMFSTIAQLLLNSKDKTRQAATTNLIVL